MPNLSKSKYLNYLQCKLLLWSHFHARADFPPTPPDRQFIFDQGHMVGDLAKRLWPGGIEVPHGRPATCAARTSELLPRRVPIFEASFLVEGRYCRVDILEPADDGVHWNLVEVKSSTRVKDVNLHDIAFQADALERAGLKLGRLELMHLDRDYTRRGELDPAKLFARVDVTARARALQPRVPGEVERAHAVIAGGRPHVPIGPHCSEPYDCDLQALCWAGVPEHHLSTLVGGKQKAWQLADDPRGDILQLPAGRLSPKQRLQQRVVREGEAEVDRAAIAQWLGRLEHPVTHLDFETFSPAVPKFDGTRPYQRIPFQWSSHVQPSRGARPTHAEHLRMEPADPRPAFLASLLQAVPPGGSILVYNAAFEGSVLRELGEAFPEHRAATDALRARIVDLADPFRAFQLYHPSQRGSYSIKRVLPAWTDSNYDDLDIAEGQAASREYEQAVYGGTLGLENDRVAAKLRDYCARDTQAMVELLGRLQALAGA